MGTKPFFYTTLPYAVHLSNADGDLVVSSDLLPDDLRDLFHVYVNYTPGNEQQKLRGVHLPGVDVNVREMMMPPYTLAPLTNPARQKLHELFPGPFDDIVLAVSFEQRCVIMSAFGGRPTSNQIASVLRGSGIEMPEYGRVHVIVALLRELSVPPFVCSRKDKDQPVNATNATSTVEFVTSDSHEVLERIRARKLSELASSASAPEIVVVAAHENLDEAALEAVVRITEARTKMREAEQRLRDLLDAEAEKLTETLLAKVNKKRDVDLL